MATMQYGGLTNQEKLVLAMLALMVNVRDGVGGYVTTTAICKMVGTINESRVRHVLGNLKAGGYISGTRLGKRTLLWTINPLILSQLEFECIDVTVYYPSKDGLFSKEV